MNSTTGEMDALANRVEGGAIDVRYAAFFECFNRGHFFEAHEELEALWLPERGRPNGPFYKGLIQLAGAFVHLQKDRPQPAAALLKLARANLAGYPSVHEHLDVAAVLSLVDDWIGRLATGGFAGNLLRAFAAPRLTLQAAAPNAERI